MNENELNNILEQEFEEVKKMDIKSIIKKVLVIALALICVISIAFNIYAVRMYATLYQFATDTINTYCDIMDEVAYECDIDDEIAEQILNEGMFDYLNDIEVMRNAVAVDRFNRIIGID